MRDLDISFGDSPWEAYFAAKRPGDRVSAVRLLSLLEGETEEGVEDAFAALEEKLLVLDISQLPKLQFTGEAALRLRQEAELVEKGMDLGQLDVNDPLRLYLEELSAIGQAGDQTALAAAGAAGDQGASEKLMYLGLERVAALAREYVGRGVLLMDLIQEGSLGLWQAIRSYRGGDYAALRDAAIHRAMAKAVTLQARSNGIGQKLRAAMEDYRAVDQRLLGELGRNPTLEEMAQALHMTPEEAAAVERQLEDARLIQRATAQPEPEEAEENAAVEDTAYFQTRQRILELLSSLTETDAKILTLRFGLEKELPLSPEETGKRLGLTPQEVLQREQAALMQLRQEN